MLGSRPVSVARRECQSNLQRLVQASLSEAWLAALHRDKPLNEELYRDPDHGFVLLAHTESAGLYRPPHDHGRAWVIYAMQDGAIEMGTYGSVEHAESGVRLVKRNSTLVEAGSAQVYFPGDIHDTRCMTNSALVFRFSGSAHTWRAHHRSARLALAVSGEPADWSRGAARRPVAAEDRRIVFVP